MCASTTAFSASTAEVVRFSVENDGQGFDVMAAQAGGENGYSSLQDLRIYVESVDGRLEVESK